jgi:hypothetical protein
MFDGGREKGDKREVVKFKDLFPAVCIVLLIFSEILLFSANHQKSLALTKLSTAQQQVAELETNLVELTNAIAANENAEITRLRADNVDLPRLRSQIQQLTTDNSKLLQQLNTARESLGQRQEQLDEMQAENEQAAEAQQAQADAVAQTEAQERAACIANLRLIYAAKQAWALDKNKTDSDTPTEQDLLPYLKGGVFPTCPSGGVYTINAVGQLPTCSIPGHVLPPQ